VGDGRTKDTEAIQGAIDTCAAAGGGIVRLSPGTYLTAPISLRSHITFEIMADATLLGSTDFCDYLPTPCVDTGRRLALVSTVDATDVAIVGDGTIDGQGQPWWEHRNDPRPRLVTFDRCQRIRVEGITLTNSPSFHLVPNDSQDVLIQDLTIQAPPNSPNTDGIDPSACRGVVIRRCLIDVGDDNIAIKSGHANPQDPDAAAADITIEDCTFLHGHGMSIGSETNGGVRNVTVRRCTFDGTTNGIRIKSARGKGGEVSCVTYHDLTMHNVDWPIVFTGYYPRIPPPGQDLGEEVTDRTPRYHDISVYDLTATDDRAGQRNAGQLIGLPESPLSNIWLANVSIEGSRRGVEIRNASVNTCNVQITPPRRSTLCD
jgi:polygalacturonase